MEAEVILASKAVPNENFNLDSSEFLSRFSVACKEEFGAETFEKWFARLEIFSFGESEVIFKAPSKFVRDWVIREFIEAKSAKLKNLICTIAPKLKKTSVIYVAKAEDEILPSPTINEQKIVNLSKYDNVFAFKTELNPRFTFANFISAKYNKLALSMAKIAAGLDAQTRLFDDKIPLFIHGAVGMGKTHLAQAIAWQIKEFDRSKKVLYLSAEKFMYHFVQSIRSNDVMSFKEKMRSIDVLIVDDLQFIAGKESTQQEFMNSFNSLVEDNKQVVLVCDRCPSDLENVDEKLKSRIAGGMVINFKGLDYADRLEILKGKVLEMKEELCPKILSFIAEKVKGSVRDLEGVLKKIFAEKIFGEKEITLELVKSLLGEYIRKSESSAPTIEKIQKIVAQFYGIKLTDLSSKDRSRSYSRPRQIAMYLAKNHTCESLPKIGEAFGGKNHATVIHSIKLIKNLLDSDAKIMQQVKELEEKLVS